ncbi:7-methylxanthosine synthase 1-like [Lolium perenne]|uniref:7-methylxanthosine synthase 1-like n=1 Tax=Lolium perenne TaxID=4522 RepID=UPI0021F66F58|nr:inactive anthranilate O-methyltransferase 1-like [Lolium perenne]
MDSKQRVHMNQGQGETSYARNSSIQSAQQNRMKPLIEAAIVGLCSNPNTLLSGKMAIADLGCSSGPNGMIDKTKFDSFYIPAYGPSAKELRVIIEEEGSSITEMQAHDYATGMDRALLTPNRIANTLRAIFEPIIVQHFGEIMDEFVRTGEKHLSLQQSSQVEGTKDMVLVSLAKA